MRPPALATRSKRCSYRQWPGHTINSSVGWDQLFSLLTIIQSIALRHFIPESEVEVLCLQSSQERSTMSTATAC